MNFSPQHRETMAGDLCRVHKTTDINLVFQTDGQTALGTTIFHVFVNWVVASVLFLIKQS